MLITMHLLILSVLYLVHSVISGPTFGYKPLTPDELQRLRNWKETDGQNVWELSGQFEGDIVLTPGEERNGVIQASKRWPNKEIPYMFGAGLTQSEKNYINQVLQDYTIYSCVRPKLITKPVRDFVLVQGTEGGCYSTLGRKGGVQILNLESGSGCHNKGTILHEFLHALGFYHQQSALERDNYVIIHKENIIKGQERNFGKSITNNFYTKYDYGSVMHYSSKAFSSNGKITIETKDKNYQNTIGQRIGFSQTDIIKLNRMYNCPK